MHETDYATVPDARAPPLEIEHFVPVARRPNRATDYGNCILICRLCNLARGTRPAPIDPTVTAWGTRFRWDGYRIEPTDPRDEDAAQTRDVYELNYPTKVTLRRFRDRIIRQYLETRAVIAALRTALEGARDPRRRAALARELHFQARTLSDREAHARRFTLVPERPLKTCRCRPPRPAWEVPAQFARQAILLPAEA